MEDDDDLLNDLLSWTPGKPSGSDTKSSACIPTAVAASSKSPCSMDRQFYPGSLQETCVNTEMEAGIAGKVGGNKCTSGNAMGGDVHQGNPPSSTEAPASVPTLRLPADLDARLYPHQREGVQWLYSRHCKSRACLLADEMGLGKTVQVAVFLGQLYTHKMIKTTILIVPPTLVPVWTAAIAEWGGDSLASLVEVIHSEARPRRQARWRKLRYGLPCVLLTTYGVLRQDAADMGATLVDYVVLDEVHFIKDSSTSAFQKALTLSARHKIALTGTPLMNTFNDLWSIFRFLDGSILGMDKAGFTAVSGILLRGNERDASAAQRQAASSELARLQAAIRPFMLRREKKDVAAGVLSSEKEDVVVWVRLTDIQQQLYTAFLNSKEVAAARDSAEDVAERTPGEGGVARESCLGTEDASTDATASGVSSNPLLLLTMLSQICSHPWLSLVDEAFSRALAHNPYAAPVEEFGNIFGGAKLWVALQLLVRCVSEGRKVLVFSRSKRLLHLLGFLLREWRLPHTQVDGEMPSDRRCAEVDRFNSDAGVWACLLTTQVGGVGLTFNGASAVVLLDPSWNPSADDQAVDRVHRIGQQRDVLIFRLITCGTVEEKVYRNQIFKRMAALQSTKGEGSAGRSRSPTPQTDGELHRYFTRLQLRSMFVMEDLEHASTAEQLELLHPGRVRSQLREELYRIEGVCNVSDNASVLTAAVDAVAGDPNDAQRARFSSASPERMCGVGSLSPAPSQPSLSQQTTLRGRSRSHDTWERDDAPRRRRTDVEGPLDGVCLPKEKSDGFGSAGVGSDADACREVATTSVLTDAWAPRCLSPLPVGSAAEVAPPLSAPGVCAGGLFLSSAHTPPAVTAGDEGVEAESCLPTLSGPLARVDVATVSAPPPEWIPTKHMTGTDASCKIADISTSCHRTDDGVPFAWPSAGMPERASGGCTSSEFASCRSSF